MTYKIPTKMLIDEKTVGWAKTTYVGRATYEPSRDSAQVKLDAIWQITKEVVTTALWQVNTYLYLPEGIDWNASDEYKFIWDNRYAYTYK